MLIFDCYIKLFLFLKVKQFSYQNTFDLFYIFPEGNYKQSHKFSFYCVLIAVPNIHDGPDVQDRPVTKVMQWRGNFLKKTTLVV